MLSQSSRRTVPDTHILGTKRQGLPTGEPLFLGFWVGSQNACTGKCHALGAGLFAFAAVLRCRSVLRCATFTAAAAFRALFPTADDPPFADAMWHLL